MIVMLEKNFRSRYGLPCKKTGDISVYETARKDIEYYYGRALITEIEKIKTVFAAADKSIR